MPPKAPRKSTNIARRQPQKASRRPSSTNVSVEGNAPRRTANNMRSTMQSIEQEPTDVGTAQKISSAAPPQQQQQQPPAQMIMKTVMLPAPGATPGAPPPVGLFNQNASSAQPPPPPLPRAPSMAQTIPPHQQLPTNTAYFAATNPPPPPAPPPAQMGQMSAVPAATPTRPDMTIEVGLPKKSRERDDAPSMEETSDRKKRKEAISSWVRLVLAAGVDALKKEYHDTPNEAPPERALAFAENPTRNRYNNILCCDVTRVKLPEDPHFYIHANLVGSGPNPRRFVCTQAPLVGTIEEFWKMIIVSGLEYIVMLCELVEKGKPKSAKYFPVKLGECLRIGKLCTVTKELSVDLDKNLTMSTMRISKIGDTAVALTVKHIHWRNWPDHGVPDSFLSPFRLLNTLKKSVKPIVVHCSAGVGRTGTLVLILIILESLCLPDFLGVPRLLTKLREERYKSIQTEMQYLYVHRCILEYLMLKKYILPNDPQYAKFLKDYEAAAAVNCKEEK